MRLLPQSSLSGVEGESFEVPGSPVLSKEAAALLEEMLPFYDRLARQTGSDDALQARTAEANRRVGAIRQRLGQSAEAMQAYRAAAAIYSALLTRSPSNADLKLGLAQTQNEFGRIHTSLRQLTEAREAHLAALNLLQDIGSLPSSQDAVRFELARTCYLLGTRDRPLPATDPRRGERPSPGIPGQRDRLALAVTLLKALPVSLTRNPEYQHLLALCYLEGAPVEETRTPEARGGAERAISIMENLVRAFPGNSDYAFDLSEAYARIHIPRPPIPPDTGRLIEERLNKSLVLLENLVKQHPEVPDFVAAEARILDKFGSFQRQLDDWTAAEQSFRKAIATQAPLTTRFPEVSSYGLWLATFRIALADVLVRRNQPDEARRELEETLSALLKQCEQRPEIQRPHDLLALGYSRLAIALRQTGNRDGAEEATRKAEQERDAVRRSP